VRGQRLGRAAPAGSVCSSSERDAPGSAGPQGERQRTGSEKKPQLALFFPQARNRIVSTLLRAYGKQVAARHVRDSLAFLEEDFLNGVLVLMPDKSLVDVALNLKRLSAQTDQ